MELSYNPTLTNDYYLDRAILLLVPIQLRCILKLVCREWYTIINSKITISNYPELLKDEEYDLLYYESMLEIHQNDITKITDKDFTIPRSLVRYLIKYNYLNTLEFVYNNGCPLNKSHNEDDYYNDDDDESDEIYFHAGFNNNFNIVRWAYDKGFKLTSNVVISAALHGHLDILKWVKNVDVNGDCKWNAAVFSRAAGTGNIEMLQWLYDNKIPWNQCAPSWAISSNHLSAVEWLREKGCDCRYTWEAAIHNKSLDTLKWLYNNEYPYDRLCYREAAYKGCLDILQWFDTIGITPDLDDNEIIRYAVEGGNMDVLKYVFDKGCRYDDKKYLLSRTQNIEIIKFIQKNL